MSKKRNNKTLKIQENIGFNEDKTIITYTVSADEPITEDDFIFCLADFVKTFGAGFDYREVGELIPFDSFMDEVESPDDGNYH